MGGQSFTRILSVEGLCQETCGSNKQKEGTSETSHKKGHGKLSKDIDTNINANLNH